MSHIFAAVQYNHPLTDGCSFMDSLNPIIMLFDPHLHTFDYIRSKSSFL